MPRKADRKERLTDAIVRAAQPEAKPYRVGDVVQEGFHVLVRPSGQKSFGVRYVLNTGKNSAKTLGRFPTLNVAQARQQAQKVRAEAQLQGTDPVEEARDFRNAAQTQRARTLATLIERYLTDMEWRGEKRASTRAKERTHLQANILPRLGHLPVSELTKAALKEALKDIRDSAAKKSGKTGASAANDCRKYLSQVLALGVDDEWLETNPVRDIKPFKEEARDRVATPDELKALWTHWEARKSGGKASGWASAAALQFALLTLQRGEEVVSLPWSEVDLQKGLWTIPRDRKKEGREAIVPLSAEALGILKKARERALSDETLALLAKSKESTLTAEEAKALRQAEEAGPESAGPFAGRAEGALRRNSFTQVFRRDCEALGIKDLTPHDMRRTGRTAITDPERLNLPPHVGEAVLNHEVGSKLQRVYDKNTYVPEKRRALNKWADYLLTVVGAASAEETSNVIALAERA